MTEKMYIQSPLQMSFDAKVLSIEPVADNRSIIILDRTCFYPTGGGQSCDRGLLNGLPVLDVTSKDGQILHTIDGTFDSDTAYGEIDASYRKGNMQAHTGQHLLSATFAHELSGETLAVKMSANAPSTVDIALANLTQEQIQMIETRTNQIIMENRPVKSYYLAPDDPQLEQLRRAVKFEKVSGDVRIVDIEGWDVSACAGTHMPSTGMLGLLKIIKSENYKGGSRITFVVGDLALEQVQQYQTILDQLGAILTTGLADLPMIVSKLQAERQESSKVISQLRETLAGYEKQNLLQLAQEIAGRRVIITSLVDRSPDELKIMANQLSAESRVVGFLLQPQAEQISLVITASSDSGVHAGNLLKTIVQAYGGRGGGSPHYAQGICPMHDESALKAQIVAILHDQLQD